ncbi:MAG: sigma-54-dependent Fis family transcriptional regulator [Deltaproteobacteria bacterium]|nr:sigma-54-dependent Fis family transcriptional regulator [Deltaproteobacteria bacterium]
MGSNPYSGYEKNRDATYKLWERFNTGALPPSEGIEPRHRLLVEEWQRCAGLGVSPSVRHGWPLGKEAFESSLAEHADLLDVVRPILDRAAELLGTAAGLLVFADAAGALLHAAGDPLTRVRLADALNFTEGTSWSELVAGNNGLGTAITLKAPVHVYASEHFCEGWQGWTCAGSPVAAPFSDDLLGVVDFSTREKDYREEAIALAHSLASQITAEMKVRLGFERVQLIQHFADWCARCPGDRFVVADHSGRVVRSSPGIPEPLLGAISKPETSGHRTLLERRPIFLAGSQKHIGTLVMLPAQAPSRHGPVDRPEVGRPRSFGRFITGSERVLRMMEQIERVIPTDLNILLIGETGTGKELIADFVHSRSSRRSGPFVPVNCGAISRDLFESKFFGYEKGAFTGADPKGRRGFFESASGGTLFLDEIAELPLDIQAALLRVLESGRIRRLGSDREVQTNCRIVSATNRPLLAAAREGHFREDLYYRLSTAKFVIPPLRERPEDIPILLRATMEDFCLKQGVRAKEWSTEAMESLTAYHWPGNGRELRNVVESSYVCSDETITVDYLPPDLKRDMGEAHSAGGARPLALPSSVGREKVFWDHVRKSERDVILAALHETRNVTLTAKRLGISRSTLYRKFDQLGIDPGQVLGTEELPS